MDRIFAGVAEKIILSCFAQISAAIGGLNWDHQRPRICIQYFGR
jgi:hypothetical protein